MKLASYTALAAVLVTGCQKQVARTDEQPPVEVVATPTPATPVPEPIAAATPVPEPIAVATPPPAPATPAPELAPEGIFYLLAPSRVETDHGLVGLLAGTGVKLVRPGVYLTPSGEVPLDPALLTNDMAKARAARDVGRAAQTAAQARVAAEGARAADLARAASANEAAQDTREQAGEAAKAQAMAQRNARIADIRQEIARKRTSKASLLKAKGFQQQANDIEAKIRVLQQELRSLGVAGGMLE